MKKLLTSLFVSGALMATLAGGAMAATVVVNENFDKVPNGQIPSYFTAVEGSWAVQDGKLVGNSTGTQDQARVIFGDPSLNNVEISATVTFNSAINTGRWTALMHHVQNDIGPSYSLFTIRQGTDAKNGFEIAYRKPGTGNAKWTVYNTATYKAPFAYGETHKVRVVVYNNSAWGFVDGEQVIYWKDAVLPEEGQGRVGLHTNGSSVTFDDVVVKTITESDLAILGVSLP